MTGNLELLHDAQRRSLAYVEQAPHRAVYPDADAVRALQLFDEPLPAGTTDGSETLALLDRVGSPATVASTGGRYFGFVVGGSLPSALAADWLVSAWDQSSTMPVNSPAVAAIEAVAARWILGLLGLPEDAAVGFVTGASIGNLVALTAARRHLLLKAGYDVDDKGLSGAPDLRVVVSDEIHATLLKMLGILGLGRARVERIPTDEQGRVRASLLPPLDDRTIVCLQAGNVNSGAFDPFREVAAATRAAGAWLHVDGAFGLWARAAPERAQLADGVELADSWVTDAHKYLNVPYDSGIVICRHPQSLRGAMSLTAAYMPVEEQVPAKDLLPEFSRRARGVPVWAALRTLGQSGVADLVERICRLAQRLAHGLADMGFEIHNDVVLNQVVASAGTPELTRRIRELVEEEGTCWFGPTRWRGRDAVRFSVSSWATTEADIDRSLAAIASAARRARAEAADVTLTKEA
jgi:glutamate/tyrosine decarboxylase-like PLP-dependent enzyme